MSLRLVFDVGLHVDPAPLGLTEKEVQIRHMVLWGSLVHDMLVLVLFRLLSSTKRTLGTGHFTWDGQLLSS